MGPCDARGRSLVMRAILVFSGLVAVGHVPVRAHADRALTIGDALERARRAYRDLVGARARLELANATVATARAALLPSITVRARSQVNSAQFELRTDPGAPATVLQPTGQVDAMVSVGVPLVAPASWYQLRAARHTATAAAAKYGVEEVAILELLAAQDAFVAAEVGVARARLDANIADLALRRAEGRLR